MTFASTVEEVQVNDIHIDPTVQRQIIPARVKAIAETLDLDAIGIVTLSKRANGDYYVLDGMHRLEALKLRDLGDWKVKSHVYCGLLRPEEAGLFRRLNNARMVTTYDDFSKGVLEGDKECVAIDSIVASVGLRVAPYQSEGTVAAVQALRHAYRIDNGVTLLATLTTSIAAWGHDPDGVSAAIISGLSLVFKTYPGIDKSVLINKLSKYPSGAAGVIGQARGLKQMKRASTARLIGAVIVECYNRGRRTGALESL